MTSENPQPETRILAVMFTDMAGSTVFVRDSGNETVRRLINRHEELTKKAVHSRKGTMISSTGDGFLATFESATDAVLAGKELLNLLRSENKDQPTNRRIEIRIGIHVGDVVMREGNVHGFTVHLASRVLSKAKELSKARANEIYFTENTFQALDRKLAQASEDIGLHDLKDIPHQVRLYKFHAIDELPAESKPPPAQDEPEKPLQAMPQFTPGQTLSGRFTLKRILGQGGMGIVWLAHHAGLGREIALKFLPDELHRDPSARDELRQETCKCLELRHDHIVQVYDFIDEPDWAAISMEYVDGETLSGLRVQRPGKVFEADDLDLKTWCKQLCDALDYAHKKSGLVHRDLKPSNLMVNSRNNLKLVDFGISRSVSDTMVRITSSKSLPRVISGSEPYMSPQQTEGKPPCVGDDIYSLGATLYELLTSKPPFWSGDISFQAREKIAPSLRERRAEFGISGQQIPKEWEETVADCLAKDPASRPKSASQVAHRLGLVEDRSSRIVPDPESKPKNESEVVQRPGFVEGRPPRKKTRSRSRDQQSESRIGTKSNRKKSRRQSLLLGSMSVLAVFLLLAAWHFGFKSPGRNDHPNKGLPPTPVTEKEKRSIPPPPPQSTLAVKAGKTVETAAFPLPELEKSLTNSLGMKFLSVEGTDVLFCIWETRVQDYESFVKASGRKWRKPNFEQGPTYPAVDISWEDATAFCNWLTEKERKEGLLGPGQKYRLPTDEEWTRAVGAGTYPWGNEWPPPQDAGNYHKELSPDPYKYTAPVEKFRANAHGLYDMGGNAWEWCEDRWGDNGEERIHRGGSWGSESKEPVLSTQREAKSPDYHVASTGFRCVVVPGKPPPHMPPTPSSESVKAVTSSQTPSREPQPSKPWMNSLGMQFVPAGTAGVLFCVWETRAQDFEKFVKATGYDATIGMASLGKDGWKARGHTWKNPGFPQGPTHPVVGMNWGDATAFCKWLTEKERKEGLLGETQEYRLPTNTEWARAAGNGQYPWGNDWPLPEGAGNLSGSEARDKDWPEELSIFEGYRDGYARTSPVGKFKPNQYGLHDLTGNAWEWCMDWYRKEMNSVELTSTLSSLSDDGGGQAYRVLHGGSWNYCNPALLLSSCCYNGSPDVRNGSRGFRCVLAFSPNRAE